MEDPGALAERLGPEVFGRILAHAMTVPDTYLHWDELRHREPPEGLDHEAWWFSLKRGRMRGAHALRHRDTVYTIQSHRRSHNVAYATARSDLLSLTRLGFLEQHKMGRAMSFRPAADLEKHLG